MGDGLKLGLEAAQTPIPDGLGGTRKLPTAIVLLSDGASTRGEDPIDIAQQAKRAKIRIYTVALGTPGGTLETKRPDGTTRSENVPPDTLTLQEIARDTGGRYFNAPDSDQLEAVYSEPRDALRDRPGEAGDDGDVRRRRAGAAARRAGVLAAARGAAAVSPRLRVVPPAPDRSPERPGPGPVPPQVLRSLDLAVMRRVESLIPGEHLTPQVGGGTDLAMIRPYRPGDDVRHIDWNVTARMNEPHVRVHVGERALTCWLLLDVSASMSFGTADRRKADVAEGVALAVGHVSTRRGNRLGVLAFGDARAARAQAAPGPARPARAAVGAAPRAGRRRRRRDLGRRRGHPGGRAGARPRARRGRLGLPAAPPTGRARSARCAGATA